MNLETYKLPTVDKKQCEWWQEIGKDMKAFGFTEKGKPANPFWIFWKFSEYKIMRAWKLAQEKDDHDFTHLLADIKRS